MSKTTTFENAKVGDKVWSIKYGFGEVDSIHKFGVPTINVKFENYKNPLDTKSYFTSGIKKNSKYTRDLYWKKVNIPTEPKRKLTKKIVVGDKITFEKYYDEVLPTGKLCLGGKFFNWETLIGKENCKIIIQFKDAE